MTNLNDLMKSCGRELPEAPWLGDRLQTFEQFVYYFAQGLESKLRVDEYEKAGAKFGDEMEAYIDKVCSRRRLPKRPLPESWTAVYELATRWWATDILDIIQEILAENDINNQAAILRFIQHDF